MSINEIIDYQKTYFPGKLVILANEFYNKQKVSMQVPLIKSI